DRVVVADLGGAVGPAGDSLDLLVDRQVEIVERAERGWHLDGAYHRFGELEPAFTAPGPAPARHGRDGAGLAGAGHDLLDLGGSVAVKTVDGDDGRQSEQTDVLDVLRQVGAAATNRARIGTPPGRRILRVDRGP